MATLAEKKVTFYQRLAEKGGVNEEYYLSKAASAQSEIDRQKASQQPTFEEQANISTYAGPAISTPSGQLTFKDQSQADTFTRQYEKELARNPRVTGGYSTPEGPEFRVLDRPEPQYQRPADRPGVSTTSVRTTTPLPRPQAGISSVGQFSQPSFKERAYSLFYQVKGDFQRPGTTVGKEQFALATNPFGQFLLGTEYGSQLTNRPYMEFQSVKANEGYYSAAKQYGAGYYLKSPEAFQAAAIGAVELFNVGKTALSKAKIEYGEPNIDPRIYVGKPIRIPSAVSPGKFDIIQPVESRTTFTQSRTLILKEGSPAPYDFPIRIPLSKLKGKSYLYGDAEVKPSKELQEFELAKRDDIAGGKLVLEKDVDKLYFTGKKGSYEIKGGLFGNKVLEEGTFTPVSQPGGIRFAVSKPKSGPLAGAKVTSFEPGAEIRGIVKPAGKPTETFQVNPVQDVTFKSGSQPEKEFYSLYESRRQGTNGYSKLQTGRAVGEIYEKQQATFDIAGLKVKKPSDFSKMVQSLPKQIEKKKINPNPPMTIKQYELNKESFGYGRSKMQDLIRIDNLKADIKKNYIPADLSGPLSKSILDTKLPSAGSTQTAFPRLQNGGGKLSFAGAGAYLPRYPKEGLISTKPAYPKERIINQRPVTTFKTNQLQFNKPDVSTRQGNLPVQNLRFDTSQLQLQFQEQAQLQDQITGTQQITRQTTAQLLRTQQVQRPGLQQRFDDSFKFPPFIIPKLPIFGSIGEGYLQRGGGGKQANRYQASLVGLLSGKKQSKASSSLSGLEVRYPVGISERLTGTRKKTRPLYLLAKGKSNPTIQGIEKQLLFKTRRRG